MVVFLILWLVKSKEKLPAVKISIAISASIVIMMYQINYRDSGLVDSGMDLSAISGHELNRELAFISSHYGETSDFIETNNVLTSSMFPIIDTFVIFATNPIPRLIWNDKPIDNSFPQYNSLRTGLTGFEGSSNITPTIPGRYYMKYGIIGVIEAGVLIGFLWFWSNIYIRKHLNSHILVLLVPVFSSSLLFIVTRDLSAGRVYPLLFLVLFLYLNRIKIKKGKGC